MNFLSSSCSSSSLATMTKMISCLVLLVLSTVLLFNSNNNNNNIFVIAQSTGASLVGSTVVDVDRTRLWIRDSQGNLFRPTNGSAPALPRYANSISYNASIAYLAKHTALYDPILERIMVFGGVEHNDYLADTPGGHPGRPLGASNNRLVIYDIRSNEWYTEPAFSPAGVLPAPRMHHAAWFQGPGQAIFDIPSTMFIYGGIGDDSRSGTYDAAFGDIWKYQNRSWSKLPFQAPRLYGHSAVTYNGKVYIFGGTSGRRYSNMLYEVDAAMDTNSSFKEITAVGDVPRPRAFHAAAISFNTITGAEILISGGHDGLNPMDDLYSFNLGTRRWQLLTRAKSDGARAYDETDTVRVAGVAVPPLAHHSCSARFPILLCVGGSATQPQVHEYDIALKRWIRSYTRTGSNLPPLVDSRSFIRLSDETGLLEMWMVGGLTGAVRKFIPEGEAFAITKTNIFTESCPNSFVNPDYAAGRCFSCPSGTVVIPDKDPHKCLACPPGTYELGGSCRNCPSGFYNPNNASSNVSSCIRCPPGRFTIGDRADSIVDCITCPIGTYASPPACVSCPAGTYGSAAGQEGYDKGCTPCPYGQYSLPGSTSCTDCPPGSSSGPYQERANPHTLNLLTNDVILPGALLPGGCPINAAPLTQVIAGTYFYVVVSLFDVGGPNGNNPVQIYDFLRNNGVWRNNLPQVTVEYDGTPSVMYYRCSDSTSLVPTCPSVTVNQTTPAQSHNQDDLGNCHQWWRWATGFYLRFDEPTTEPVTLTIRGTLASPLRPLQLRVQVIAFGTAIEILDIERLYVASQTVPTTFRALDLLNRFDAGASDSVTINVQCNSGSPALTLNGTVGNTFTFSGGVHTATVGFTTRAEGCRFRYTRNGVTTNDPLTPAAYFSVQEGANLIANTSFVNMTNGGWIEVTCELIDTATGVTMFGDNISTLRLDLVNNTFTQFWNVRPKDFSKRVIAGLARWSFQIYSAFPVPSTLQPAFFTCNHISGAASLLPPVDTNNFTLNGRVNGTEIRLNTDFGSWPTVISANTSFRVTFERIDPLTGSIDGSQRLTRIQLELFNCPNVRLSTGNSSSPFIFLIHGRATTQIRFTGQDTDNCIVLVREVGQPDPERRLKAFWTPYFDISTPAYLGHDGCAFTDCATCLVGVGKTVVYTVTVYNTNGTNATNDQRTIVQLQFTGNTSGAIETTGTYEKRVNDGVVTFSVQFLPTTVPTGLLFIGGYWIAEPVFNITYETVPVFREIKRQTGEAPVFYRGVVRPIYTCPILLDQSATRLRLIGNVPDWIPSGTYIPLQVEAITDFGTRALGYNEPYLVGVLNCNGGVQSDIEYRYKSFSVPETLFTTTNFVIGHNFQNSVANFDMSILYKTQSNYVDGLKNCSIRVRSGTLPDLIVEGFDINRVFKSCRMCEPGKWSPGGNGVDAATAPLHPGGCIDCLIGTFSTVSGASSESECEVCSVGNGYVRGNLMHTDEGRTTCDQCGPLNTTQGLPGGGGCPGGNIAQTTAITTLWQGRLGRRCTLAECTQTSPCPNGQFRLFCTAYGNQNDCEGAWNQGACFWTGAACSGASALCMDCPAGTVAQGATNNGYFATCIACGPGQYSSSVAHTNWQNFWQYEEWRCGAFTRYPVLCQGTGVESCPNGTYQPLRGQTTNASCITCPAGTYAFQVPALNSQNCPSANCPTTDAPAGGMPSNNPYCTWNPGSCWRCPLNARTSGGNPFLVAPTRCTPCPAGTFNPKVGSSDPADCLPCRAGTFCPEGSFTQNVTDTNTSDPLKIDLSGFTPPSYMSLAQSGGVMQCADRFVSDYSGYVLDGTFSNYVQRYFVIPNNLGASYVNRWRDESFHSPYNYDTQDRLGSANSGSLRCNATGCTVSQNITVGQEIAEEVVFRAWVYIRTANASIPYTQVNTSVLYDDHPNFVFERFAGFNITLHSHPNSAFANTTYVNQSIDLVRNPNGREWVLLEQVFMPPFPIKVATFSLQVRGFYNVEILFDDVAMRPSGNRICNCSTGFYFNASNPLRHCLRCPPGFECAGGILKRCVNSWSSATEPGCRRCRPNWMCDADGRGRLISCPLYTYKSNTTETCERCPNGHACQDGFLIECSGGRYGDGGLECKLCSPGYYSLPGAPRVECLRCPIGTTSNAMRTGCFQCPVDHYSPDGLQCLQCPDRTYQPFTGQGECRPCDALYLQAWNYTVYRNSQQMLEVLPRPCSCVEDYAWRVEAIHQISGANFGEASRSLSTKKTIRYTAGAEVGTHIFRVHLTSNDGATLQVALITVDIENRAPIAVADLDLTIVHPTEDIIYNLTSLLFNDYDLDLDNLYFATLTPNGAQYNATGLTISADRRTAFVSLPRGFIGQALFSYSVMDQFRATPAACVAPDCLLSSVVEARLVSKRVGPVAVDDTYDVLNGEVYSLDVMANDFDVDGDDRFVTATTVSANGANPQPASTCSTGCAASCLGVPSCTCAFDAQRNRCWPSNNRPNTVQYTAPTTICGTDTFTYTVTTNDGSATGTVSARIRRCYCATHNPPIYFQFVLDGTTGPNDFAHQLAYVDAVQRRTNAASGNFHFGIYIAGINQVLAPFTNNYIDTQDLQWPEGAAEYPYNLGATMTQMPTDMNWATYFPALATNRVIATIYISGKNSEDSVVAADAALKAAWINQNVVISVNPDSASNYNHALRMGPRYTGVFTSFDQLISADTAAQNTMDEICSL